MITRIRHKLRNNLWLYFIVMIVFVTSINILMNKLLELDVVGSIITSFILTFIYVCLVFAGGRK